jgi:hypothetical protein
MASMVRSPVNSGATMAEAASTRLQMSRSGALS